MAVLQGWVMGAWNWGPAESSLGNFRSFDIPSLSEQMTGAAADLRCPPAWWGYLA